jgi:hypothetical protein
MRAVFLFGGFVGFVVVAACGLQAGRSGQAVLIDASLACLATALLFRWFWSRVVIALTDTVKRKRAARAVVEEAAAAARATPVAAIKTK